MEDREKQARRRIDFLIKYCGTFKPAQLMQMWWVLRNSSCKCARIFAEWAYLTGRIKIRCLKFGVEDCKRRKDNVEKSLLKMPAKDLCGCKEIDISTAKILHREPIIHIEPTTTTIAGEWLFDEFDDALVDLEKIFSVG